MTKIGACHHYEKITEYYKTLTGDRELSSVPMERLASLPSFTLVHDNFMPDQQYEDIINKLVVNGKIKYKVGQEVKTL